MAGVVSLKNFKSLIHFKIFVNDKNYMHLMTSIFDFTSTWQAFTGCTLSEKAHTAFP